ncbi:hypothetical protein [Halovenus halobia]|jgi:hypothetical protein|uniref:hypothetical protein n=1 Tax=Halovenus halobia TaxID=3396622 RepID=UPI003F55FC71
MERSDAATQQQQLLPRLKVAFVVLVAVSAGLIAAYADGSFREALFAVGGGTLVGVGLVWIAFPSSSGESESPDRSVNRR